MVLGMATTGTPSREVDAVGEGVVAADRDQGVDAEELEVGETSSVRSLTSSA
jgi:hypothetical protein